MKILINRDKCVGAGQCVLAAPEIFQQSEDDGLVVVRLSEPPEHLHDSARAAANLCPALVITVTD